MEFEEIVKTIETRREALKRIQRVIEVIDYGAGNPQEQRTKETMEAGVKVKIPLSELARIGVKEEKAREIFKIFTAIMPKVILELGTCCGFSSSYFSFFAPEAKIYTIEGSPNIANIAKENHHYFGLSNIEVLEGRFGVVLPKLLESIAPLDFVFIDGHHDKCATLAYLHEILPFIKGGGVMLFDDIAWSAGMQEAWQEIWNVIAKAHKKASVVGKGAWQMGVVWL